MFKWCYIRAKLKESDAAWKFRDAVSASAEVYYGRKMKRDKDDRESYLYGERPKFDKDDLFITDIIIRQEIDKNDPRIQ